MTVVLPYGHHKGIIDIDVAPYVTVMLAVILCEVYQGRVASCLKKVVNIVHLFRIWLTHFKFLACTDHSVVLSFELGFMVDEKKGYVEILHHFLSCDDHILMSYKCLHLKA